MHFPSVFFFLHASTTVHCKWATFRGHFIWLQRKQILRPSGYWIFYNAQGSTFSVVAAKTNQNFLFMLLHIISHFITTNTELIYKVHWNATTLRITPKVKVTRVFIVHYTHTRTLTKKPHCIAFFSDWLMQAVWVSYLEGSCYLRRLTKYFIPMAEWMLVSYTRVPSLPGRASYNIMYHTWVKG